MVTWIARCFLTPAIIGMAIDRWGYRFLFVDFAPNLQPSVLERRLVAGGQIFSVLVLLGGTIAGLFHLEHLSDLWSLLGAELVLVFVLAVLLGILLPFLVIVLTAFRIRPVIDKAPAK